MEHKKEHSGVYETMRSFSGVFVFLEEHKERIERSCLELGLETPDLAEITEKFVETDVRLRVSVSAHGDLEVVSHHLPAWNGSYLFDKIWKVKPVKGERWDPKIKSTDTDFQAKERKKAKDEGFGEILMVNNQGNITEGGITNVFFVVGDHLITPGKDILPGISRSLIFMACEDLKIEIIEREVALTELEGFDAVFLTNAIRGIVSTGLVLPLMQRIVDWCSDYLKGKIDEQR